MIPEGTGSPHRVHYITPAHATRLERDGGRARLTLSEPSACMDRDFILVISSETLPRAFAAIIQHPDMEVTFDILTDWGVPGYILDLLRDYLDNHVDAGASRQAVETAVAFRLVLSAAKRSGSVSRDDVRVLRKVVGRFQVDKALERMTEGLV